MLPEALEARLKVLEDEILRLSKLASEASHQLEQDKYWTLALDLQREARELRAAKRIWSLPAQIPHRKPTSLDTVIWWWTTFNCHSGRLFSCARNLLSGGGLQTPPSK